MKTAQTCCSTCGGVLDDAATPLGQMCPACLFRASETPGHEEPREGAATTWAEVFPQLEVVEALRTSAGYTVYRANLLGSPDGEGTAILQIVSGARLTEVGGANALERRARQLASIENPKLSAVLDYGDLADAFFLVTRASNGPMLLETLEGCSTAQLSDRMQGFLQTTSRLQEEGQVAGLNLSIDPALCFVGEAATCSNLILTPSLLPEERDGTTDTRDVARLEPGARVGDFVLERKVGEGGFGVVWKAHQEKPVKRSLVLKVLKVGLNAQRIRARFEIEQQALARLNHTNIARFIEGGTLADGRPYIAMEWIEGASLVHLCREHSLPLTDRLTLFKEVCDALHHAHQRGIIHRDLKPSNVMVAQSDRRPSAKVIDFGIARNLEPPPADQSLLTRAEEILGTPAAMSPEQAAGSGGAELDARTDIYGLGIVLYHLLTGKYPFDPSQSLDVLRQQIREEDPPKPSSVLVDQGEVRKVRGDLSWITLKCLAKDPDRRYRSVSALIRDLERYASVEPVEAGPPELGYRLRKFARRHRAMVISVASVMVAVIAGGLLALDGYREAGRQAAEALRAQSQAEEEAATAAQIAGFLQDHFFGQLNPDNNPKINLSLQEAVAQSVQALEAQPLGSAEVEGELRLTLAESLEGLGQDEAAERHYELAALRLTEARGIQSRRAIQAQTGRARVLSRLGRFHEACDIQEEVVESEGIQVPLNHESLLRSRRVLGGYLMSASRLQESAELLEDVFEEQRQGYGMYHVDTLESLAMLSRFHGSYGKDFGKALEIRKDLDVTMLYREGSPEAITILHRVDELRVSSEETEALKARLDRLGFSKTLDSLLLRLEYAKALVKQVAYDEAILIYKDVLTELERSLGKSHPKVLAGYEGFIWAMYMVGKRDEIPGIVEPLLARLADEDQNLAKYERLVMRYHGLFGNWKAVASYYRRAASRLDRVSLEWGQSAILAFGDDEGLDAILEETLKKIGETEDPYAAAAMGLYLLNAQLFRPAIDEVTVERVDRYAQIAQRRPDHGKTRILGARLALARGEIEDADRLLEFAGLLETSRYDVFDRFWMIVLEAICAEKLGDQPRRDRLIQRAEAEWKSKLLTRIRWWPGYVPAAIALDRLENQVGGKGPESSRLSKEGFGHTDADYLSILAVRRVGVPTNEGMNLYLQRQYKEAMAKFEEALEYSQDALGETHAQSLLAKRWIATCLSVLERHEDAVRVWREIHQLVESLYPNDQLKSLMNGARWGIQLSQSAPHRLAVDVLEDMVGPLETLSESQPDALAWLDLSLGGLLVAYRHLEDPDGIARSIHRRWEWSLTTSLEYGSPNVRSTLISPVSRWRWFHPVDGVDPAEQDPDFHQSFFLADYNDGAWEEGHDASGSTGGFGYGDTWFDGVDIGQPSAVDAEGKTLGRSAYFRHRFTTDQEHRNLELRCQRDDGIIVYLNGKEVARDNVQAGEEAFELPAVDAVGQSDTDQLKEQTVYRVPLKGVTLPPGDHVLAISLHNTEAPSSDLRLAEISLVEVEWPEAPE